MDFAGHALRAVSRWSWSPRHRAASSDVTVTPSCPQAPPSNPIAAGPDGGRVLPRAGAADHAVTPQAPVAGSGCREHSNDGFGRVHPISICITQAGIVISPIAGPFGQMSHGICEAQFLVS